LTVSVAAADVFTSSPEYARRFAGPVGEWFLAVQAEITLDLLRPWPGASVVDVGGGHGQLVAPLTAAGHPVTVFASSEECRRGVSRWIDRGQAAFQAGDLLRMPFAPRAFEVAVAYRLLPHVEEWRALLAEMCRVARRAVIVDYPTTRSANVAAAPTFALKKRVETGTRPFAVFRDRDVEAALAAAGWRVTARRPEFLLPMALHRAMRLAPVSRALEAAGRALTLTRRFGSPVILRAEPRG
jgi:2-polyprenyl-3-methyl-5-hydroxy-6-metoxy-1,4-benzoquinol methylase